MENTELRRIANRIRNVVVDMCARSGGHIASSLSCVELLVALYHGGVLRVSSQNPDQPSRDRFILSKGHAETVYYALLADLGYFPKSWLETSYRRGDCKLGGHPDHNLPGVEISSGALGHGLGIGAGLALAARLAGSPRRQIVLMGDAECTEGSVWEAAMFAASHKLDNLVGIVDRNMIGSLDFTDNYTALEPFAEKWSAFGWRTLTVDGHDFDALLPALDQACRPGQGAPSLIVAQTVKGKGVSFIENDPCWHVKCISCELEVSQAKEELRWKG